MTTPHSGLGRRSVAGSAWMIASAATTRFASLAAQIVLGYVLSREDFGVYALAIGFAALVQAMRDGGMKVWLLAQPDSQRTEATGLAFWLALTVNLALGLLIVGLAPLAAAAYGEPDVRGVLLVIGLSLPTGTFAAVHLTRLQQELRFRHLALIEGTSSIMHYVLVVALALAGFGPLSFVLPLIAAYVFEGGLGRYLTGLRLSRTRPHLSQWARVAKASAWILVAGAATGLLAQADYFVLGLLSSTATVGIYFFGYQLAAQGVGLVRAAIQRVLMPSLVAAKTGDRQERGIDHAGLLLALAGTPFVMVLGLAIPGVEQLVWRGRWGESVAVVQLLCLGLPAQLIQSVGGAALMARQMFKSWSLVLLAKGLGLPLTVWLASWGLPPGVEWIAGAVGAYIAASSLAALWIQLHMLNVKPGPIMRPLVGIYLGYVFLAVASGAFSLLLIDQVGVIYTSVLGTGVFLFAAFAWCIYSIRRAGSGLVDYLARREGLVGRIARRLERQD
jgi:O-antigen/teichoic acid export membrane protein